MTKFPESSNHCSTLLARASKTITHSTKPWECSKKIWTMSGMSINPSTWGRHKHHRALKNYQELWNLHKWPMTLREHPIKIYSMSPKNSRKKWIAKNNECNNNSGQQNKRWSQESNNTKQIFSKRNTLTKKRPQTYTLFKKQSSRTGIWYSACKRKVERLLNNSKS